MALRFLATSGHVKTPPNITVAIIGPPNAGKSTLYNRFLQGSPDRPQALKSENTRARRKSGQVGAAIVSPVSGTTRDRRECVGGIGDLKFKLYDTAGVDNDVMSMTAVGVDAKHRNRGSFTRRKRVSKTDLTHSTMAKEDVVLEGMVRQTLAAAEAADVVLLMFDARTILKGGSNVEIIEMGRWLRKNINSKSFFGLKRRVVLVANKLEGEMFQMADPDNVAAFDETSTLGFGEAVCLSATHGDGMFDLAAIFSEVELEKTEFMKQHGLLPASREDDEEDDVEDPDALKPITMAILGRQNVGKSTLLNKLINEDRVITGSMAGLTRDAIAVDFKHTNEDGLERQWSIVDTAGVRREPKRDNSNTIESDSVRDTIRALKLAHVCVLVVDADGGHLSRTEATIADMCIQEGRALVVVANKADVLIEAYGTPPMSYAEDVKKQITDMLPHVGDVVVIPTSCISEGEDNGLDNLLPVVEQVFERWNTRINTGALNQWFKDVLFSHPPPHVKGRAAKMKYIVQAKSRPPTFLISANCSEKDLDDSYIRYIRNEMRSAFHMEGLAIRINFKNTADNNPYAHKKRNLSSKDARRQEKQRSFGAGSIGRARYKQIRIASKKEKAHKRNSNGSAD
jgi:GTP-binding protein